MTEKVQARGIDRQASAEMGAGEECMEKIKSTAAFPFSSLNQSSDHFEKCLFPLSPLLFSLLLCRISLLII